MLACRLNLADATSNEEIEQQLAEPWSDTQVVDAFQETLAGWKARTKPKRMTGQHPILVRECSSRVMGICELPCTSPSYACPVAHDCV